MANPRASAASVPDDPPPALGPDHSLFLDFDGTLVELAATPDGIAVDDELRTLLADLTDTIGGRVAIVSGRSIAQLDQYLGDAASRLAVAGSHGAEHRSAATGHATPHPPAGLAEAAQELFAFADLNGVIFEAKTLGAALHFRRKPGLADEAERLASSLATEHGLTLQRGKMMIELRAPGDKGAAIRTLMAEPAFAGTSPVFLGDDVTDEDGFAAAADLGGLGVLVGEPRASAARYRLADVAAVRAWLRDAADAMRG